MYDAESFRCGAMGLQTLERIRVENSQAVWSKISTGQSTQYNSPSGPHLMRSAGKSNQARKVNGDLFERFIRLLIVSLKVECVSGTMQVPVKDEDGTELFQVKLPTRFID